MISPTFYTYAHIALQGGVCSGGASCNTVLTYSAGIPGQIPVAKVTVNPLSSGYAAAIKITVQSGKVLISVGPQPSSFPYAGTLTILLTDQSPCGSGVRCSTAGASLVVTLAGG